MIFKDIKDFPIIVRSQTQQIWDAQFTHLSVSEIFFGFVQKKGDPFGDHCGISSMSCTSSQAIVADLPKMVGCQGKILLRDSLKIRTMPRFHRQRKAALQMEVLVMCRLWYIPLISWGDGRYMWVPYGSRFGNPEKVHHFMIYFKKTSNLFLPSWNMCRVWFWGPRLEAQSWLRHPISPPLHGIYLLHFLGDMQCAAETVWSVSTKGMSPLACPFGSILGIKMIGFDSNIRSIRCKELDIKIVRWIMIYLLYTYLYIHTLLKCVYIYIHDLHIQGPSPPVPNQIVPQPFLHSKAWNPRGLGGRFFFFWTSGVLKGLVIVGSCSL